MPPREMHMAPGASAAPGTGEGMSVGSVQLRPWSWELARINSLARSPCVASHQFDSPGELMRACVPKKYRTPAVERLIDPKMLYCFRRCGQMGRSLFHVAPRSDERV